MARILITDGDERSALAIVRSLSSAGHHCLVGSTSGRTLAGASHYCRMETALPDPATRPGDYIYSVRSLVDAARVDVVLPVTEASLLALLPGRNEIAAVIPFPDLEAFQAICDKKLVLESAESVGIHIPRQHEVRSAVETIPSTVRYPLVLKPARSVFTGPDGTRGKVGVRWARDEDEAISALRRFPADAFPILAQEAVSGPGVGIFVLLSEGNCIAQFSHRRVREKPPTGGVSVLRQSEPMDERLLSRSLALLARFNWSGVAMVEYKLDSLTGEAFLMEINGRFWGSLQLAVDAGVDFPRLLVDIALGRPTTPVHDYRFVRSRWFWGDVDHLIARWREPDSSWQSRSLGVLSLLRGFGPGYREEVLRWTDPRPFYRETITWLRNISRPV